MKKYLLLTATSFLVFPHQTLAEEDVYTAAESIVTSQESVYGVVPGQRRNHAKGFCFAGTFTPAEGALAAYTSSPVFAGPSDVIGRFSHGGGNLQSVDSKHGTRGMALLIETEDGDAFVTAMINRDFFPFNSTQDFANFFRARLAGPDQLDAFLSDHETFKRFKAHHAAQGNNAKPYEATKFNSINSFYLVSDDGNRTAVRWSFEPATSQEQVVEASDDFLFANLLQNLKAGPISWNMVVTLAKPGDDVNDPTIMWTGERTRINAGVLTVSGIQVEAEGQCYEINYDPQILPDGMDISDDPMIPGRSAAYAISVGKRLSEAEGE